MKKISALLSLLLMLLAACSSSGTSKITAPTGGEVEPPQAASPTEPPAVGAPAEVQSTGAFVPATAVSEAAIIREQDHVLGAEDPVVAIIEYGDYQ